MTEAQTINGVNVAAVNELVKNVESDPQLGECKFHIKNTWSTCGQNQSKVSSFYAAKQEIPHDNPFTLKADEPPILAGHDTGANPVEHLLHALAGCLTTTLVYHAAVRGIKVEALESELEGDLDIRGFLGLSNTVRSGFENIRVSFKVKTGADNIEKGSVEKSRQRRSRHFFCAHVLSVRSARKNGCGLAGRTFLNRPGAFDE